jgi:hypothetical protein
MPRVLQGLRVVTGPGLNKSVVRRDGGTVRRLDIPVFWRV